MISPEIKFMPLVAAVASEGPQLVELLITIKTPSHSKDLPSKRPSLNLALVIDCSGSMAGSKLSYARKAARYLAGELTERDRLAIVTFDDEVKVLVPSQPVRDPLLFISAINTIDAGGCTALFDGWLAGATQVANQLDPGGINRVLLLSDGQANEGLTDSNAIAAKVRGLTQRRISTSAFGLGLGFDEDLMGAVATAGDGTFAQIESPKQLADLYAYELRGLASTLGRMVILEIKTNPGAQLQDVLNDLPQSSESNFQLPNLRYGQELGIGIGLFMPGWLPNKEIASVSLSWENPDSGDRKELTKKLVLPVKPHEEVDVLDVDCEVAEKLAFLHANRERRLAIEALDRGNLSAAMVRLEAIDERLAALPQNERVQRERSLITEKMSLLRHDPGLSRKRLRSESLRSSLNVWEEVDEDS